MRCRMTASTRRGVEDSALLTMDGYDDCIVGIVHRFNAAFVLYDEARVIATLVERDGMTHDEAHEFFEFNMLGAWHGQRTVGFLERPDTEESK